MFYHLLPCGMETRLCKILRSAKTLAILESIAGILGHPGAGPRQMEQSASVDGLMTNVTATTEQIQTSTVRCGRAEYQ